MRLLASLFVVGLLGACEPTVPEGRFACERDEDCPEEMVCRPNVGRCFSTLGDAQTGAMDAGASDAGRDDEDAGSADATDAATDAAP